MKKQRITAIHFAIHSLLYLISTNPKIIKMQRITKQYYLHCKVTRLKTEEVNIWERCIIYHIKIINSICYIKTTQKKIKKKREKENCIYVQKIVSN